MTYLILLFVLKAIDAPTWLFVMDVICMIVKLILCGVKLGSPRS